jgi:BCCIP
MFRCACFSLLAICTQPVIQALTKYLLSAAGEHEADLRAVLSDDQHAGLLVHEQLLNLPIQIKPKLHEALREDIEWALQHEVSMFTNRYFLFTANAW